jgi:hypothetical protein
LDLTSPLFLVKRKPYLLDLVADLYGLFMSFASVAEVPRLPVLGVVGDSCVFFSAWLYNSIRYILLGSIILPDWK